MRLVRPNGEAWSFDSAARLVPDQRMQMTTDPIEDGSPFSDHIFEEPSRLMVAVGVTQTPLQDRSWGQPTGPARVEAAQDFLRRASRELLTVEIYSEVFEGYAILGVTEERTAIRGRRFQLELREVVIARAQTVEIPATQPPPEAQAAMADEVDAGEQAGSSDAADDRDRSWLHQLVYGSEAT